MKFQTRTHYFFDAIKRGRLLIGCYDADCANS